MRSVRSALAIAAALAAAVIVAAAQSQPFSIIFRNGTVIDGTGGARFRADVAISGAAVARVGNLSNQRAALEIDATGLIVAPGFINIHSHATADGLQRAENMLTQGVTTEIVNADGAGPLDIAEQLDRAVARGLAVNLGAQIGFNSV
jgi:N-acyl-D-amino-acid deacylase